MKIGILACSVFEPELEKVLSDIENKKLFEDNIKVTYLHFGLHTNLDKLEKDVIADASTVEGVRVHAVIAPLVPQGAAISIRLPDAVAPSLESLAENGMLEELADGVHNARVAK